ncbi:hypothetical protein [Hahella ganghwensis]|uniref:hypothetical protein n=1 Tax=Hahella ganghwensis TaxID=286420 RepID=UPI000376ED7B|nr:hypothetical protein [Hahella ganghwensis]
MNLSISRRMLLRSAAAITGLGVLGGCSDEKTSKPALGITVPPFSADHLHLLLERLLAAYESKGFWVSETLLPPLTDAEIREQCHWFPGNLSPEIISLYQWRGGQENEAWEEDYPFWFRDNTFTSLARAEQEYKSMMASYGQIAENHDLLNASFPIAAFNGAWYVIPTGKHAFDSSLPRPVISVHEGVEVHFYSIETMVATCVDWVSHPEYSIDGTLPREVELSIWKQHNPGIFDF